MKQEKWVLDGSCALAWALPDEHSQAAESFLKQIGNPYTVWVPALFWYEIANVLTVAERRQRITEAQKSRLFDLFMELPLYTDAMIMGSAFLRYAAAAAKYNLSVYDAAYLELACRRNMGLATFDEKLEAAARDAGAAVWRAKKLSS